MNLLEQAKHIPHGLKVISEWLGSGGEVVDKETAQERANTCLKCPSNVEGSAVTAAVAGAIKRHLEVKNRLGLTVDGAKKLKMCNYCGCQLNLLIWQKQEKVESELSDMEKESLPAFCWKLPQ